MTSKAPSWRIRLFCLAGLLAASIVLHRDRAEATMGAYLTPDALVRNAEVIVRGTVVHSETAWGPDRRYIWTLTTVHVTRYLKGSGRDTIVVRTLGGAIGTIRAGVAGEPTFVVGQDVMLFLHPRGALYGLTGMAQGAYFMSSTGGVPTATRDLSGLTLIAPPGSAAPPVHEAAMTAAELEANVVRLVGGAR